MPEGPEIKIMSDFIQKSTNNKVFTKIFTSPKNNNFIDITNDIIKEDFKISTKASGKELSLYLNENTLMTFFMGMTGNWKFVKNDEINNTNWIRARFDTTDGYSLICYGGYMGPKWTIGKFKGTKRGPDPTIEFNQFKSNILENLDKKIFSKPVYETLLDQQYFSGVGNYVRSTIIYYLDCNPFTSCKEVIEKHGENFFEMCRDVINKSYKLNGGQLRDWKNPLDVDSSEFKSWVFYEKGLKLKDSNNRTFWYDKKWEPFKNNIYKN